MHVYACARFRPARAAGLAGVPDVASGLLGDGGGHPRAVRVPGLDSDGSSGAGEARDAGASIGASRAALRRAARVREQQGLRLAASRRFDPAVIDRATCLAKIYGIGLGGQCGRPQQVGSTFCGRHTREERRPHGVVGEAVPAAKLDVFLKAEHRRLRAERTRASSGDAASSRARVQRPPNRAWYTRHEMLRQALRLDTPERRDRIRVENCGVQAGQAIPEDVSGLVDLEPWEYDQCLLATNEVLKHHAPLRAGLKRNMGPESAVDPERSTRERYNGSRGFYCWFRWGVFERFQAARGLSDDQVSELVCVELLEETSKWISAHPHAKAGLTIHGGPQCYPAWLDQVSDRRLVREAGPAPFAADGGSALERLDARWIPCRDSGRHRLVDSSSLPALMPDGGIDDQSAGFGCGDWSEYLAGAEGRYDAFIAAHRGAADDAGIGGLGAPAAAATGTDPMRSRQSASVAAAVERPQQDCLGDESEGQSFIDDAVSEVSSDGSMEEQTAIGADFAEAVAALGSRSGGPSTEELRRVSGASDDGGGEQSEPGAAVAPGSGGRCRARATHATLRLWVVLPQGLSSGTACSALTRVQPALPLAKALLFDMHLFVRSWPAPKKPEACLGRRGGGVVACATTAVEQQSCPYPWTPRTFPLMCLRSVRALAWSRSSTV